MFKLKVVTPEGEYLNREIESLSLPTLDGIQTILPNHMAIVIPLDIGICTIKDGKQEEQYAISNGLFTFEDNVGSLIVNSIESSDEIDYERALRAHERAKEVLQRKESSDEMRDAELALKRSLVRMRLENEKSFK